MSYFVKNNFRFLEIKVDGEPEGRCYDHIPPIPHYETGLNNDVFHHESHDPTQLEIVDNNRIRMQDGGQETGSISVTCRTSLAEPLPRSPVKACQEQTGPGTNDNNGPEVIGKGQSQMRLRQIAANVFEKC